MVLPNWMTLDKNQRTIENIQQIGSILALENGISISIWNKSNLK